MREEKRKENKQKTNQLQTHMQWDIYIYTHRGTVVSHTLPTTAEPHTMKTHTLSSPNTHAVLRSLHLIPEADSPPSHKNMQKEIHGPPCCSLQTHTNQACAALEKGWRKVYPSQSQPCPPCLERVGPFLCTRVCPSDHVQSWGPGLCSVRTWNGDGVWA